MKRIIGGFLLVLGFWGGILTAQPDTLWTRSYGGVNSDEAWCMTRAQDGGFVLGGYTFSFGAGRTDMYIIRAGTSGIMEWQRFVGGSDWDYCNGICKCPNGDYIAAGGTCSYGPGIPDWYNIYITRIDSNGDSIWTRMFGGDRSDMANAIQSTMDGGCIIAGYTESFGSGAPHTKMFLLKLNADGDSLWMNMYGDSLGYEFARALDCMNSGDFVLGGQIMSGPNGGGALVSKINDSGMLEWTTQFSIEQRTEIYAISEVNGGIAVAGNTKSDTISYDPKKMFLAKLSFEGDTLWTRTYSGNGYDLDCYDMQVTLDGGFILAGVTYNPLPFPYFTNSYLIRTDSVGNELWRGQYGQYYEDEAHAVLVLEDGSYAIAGSVHTIGAARDCYLVRTERDPALDVHDRPIPAPRVMHVSCYPNPFNTTTTISFTLPKASEVKMEVYDVLGREVKSAYPCGATEYSAGEHHVAFDGSELPSGIYFVRVEAGGMVQTKKMMLLR